VLQPEFRPVEMKVFSQGEAAKVIHTLLTINARRMRNLMHANTKQTINQSTNKQKPTNMSFTQVTPQNVKETITFNAGGAVYFKLLTLFSTNICPFSISIFKSHSPFTLVCNFLSSLFTR
jgi:hypothetical protein